MKKHIFKIIAVVNIVLLVFCMFTIHSLKNDIKQMKTSLMETQEMKNDIYNELNMEFGNQIDDRLEEFNNIAAEASYTYSEEYSSESNTAIATVEVLPKECTEGVTKAYLVSDKDETFPLEFSNGKFIGEIEVGLFDRLNISHLKLDTNGKVISQKLNWEMMPKEEYFPDIELYQHCEVTPIKGDDLLVNFDPVIDFFIHSNNESIDYKSADIIVTLDGKKIDSIPFDDVTIDKQEVSASLLSQEKTYKTKKNSKMFFYLDVKEKDFTHRYLLNYVILDKKGESVPSEKLNEYTSQEVVIKQGNKILYNVDSKVFSSTSKV